MRGTATVASRAAPRSAHASNRRRTTYRHVREGVPSQTWPAGPAAGMAAGDSLAGGDVPTAGDVGSRINATA